MAVHVRYRLVVETARDADFTLHSMSEDVTNTLSIESGARWSNVINLQADAEESHALGDISRLRFLYVRVLEGDSVRVRWLAGEKVLRVSLGRPLLFEIEGDDQIAAIRLQREPGTATAVLVEAIGTSS
jgi:hypothetical protein